MSEVADLMRSAAAEMTAALEAARLASSHGPTTGAAAEAALRQFLRGRLPRSVGVCEGHIVDQLGNKSPQCDVILFDESNTPMLWADKEQNHRLVPSEGVIAVIEVKSSVTGADADSIVKHMRGVKSLDKTAFYPDDSARRKIVHGVPHEIAPTLYFVFAYESSSLENLSDAFIAAMNGSPVARRIDSIYSLGRGVIVWRDPETEILDSAPKNGDHFVTYPTEQVLLMFTLLTFRYLTQLGGRIPNLQKYIPPDFVF